MTVKYVRRLLDMNNIMDKSSSGKWCGSSVVDVNPPIKMAKKRVNSFYNINKPPKVMATSLSNGLK